MGAAGWGNVSVAGVMLQLDEVADLPRLAGRDDAFRLEFTGPAEAVQSGIHEFRQAQLGTFVMFVSPVDIVLGSDSRYEVVVDRSVGVPGSVPKFGSMRPSARQPPPLRPRIGICGARGGSSPT